MSQNTLKWHAENAIKEARGDNFHPLNSLYILLRFKYDFDYKDMECFFKRCTDIDPPELDAYFQECDRISSYT